MARQLSFQPDDRVEFVCHVAPPPRPPTGDFDESVDDITAVDGEPPWDLHPDAGNVYDVADTRPNPSPVASRLSRLCGKRAGWLAALSLGAMLLVAGLILVSFFFQ